MRKKATKKKKPARKKTTKKKTTKKKPARKKASKKKTAKKKATRKKPTRKKAAKKKPAKKKPARKKAAKTAANDSTLCTVTGLPTGAEARARWQAGLDQARATGTSASLLLIDVDDFSEHVKALGLERSDAVLHEVARRLQAALSDAAYLGRVGGDCFGVVLPAVAVEGALGVSERTRAAATKRSVRVGRGANRRELSLSLSAGIAGLDRDGETLDQLLTQALAALWRAKTQGGDRTALPVAERKQLKTTYYEQGQFERLKRLAARSGIKESVLLREALEDLLLKYKSRRVLPLP